VNRSETNATVGWYVKSKIRLTLRIDIQSDSYRIGVVGTALPIIK